MELVRQPFILIATRVTVFRHILPALFILTAFFLAAPADAATVPVPAGADLQAYLNNAQPGDTLVLAAGAVYSGWFVLPYKGDADASFITITTSAAASLPGPNQRLDPGRHSNLLPKIVSPGSDLPALRTELKAHHYKLIGLEVSPASPAAYVGELISFGSLGPEQATDADAPHDLVIDRCYIHGWPDTNYKRGIGLNSRSTDILNSYISDFHSDFQDSQAIGGFNGRGPFNIINNYLEAAGENIMFGGALAPTPGLVPTGIQIRHNYFYKPWSWKNWTKVDAAIYAATPPELRAQQVYGGYAPNFIIQTPGKYTPVVKNLFEIKSGQDVILDGNIFENNWVQADQHGTAIVLTPRVLACAMPWAVVQNVRFTNNILRNAGGFVSFLGKDEACQTSPRTNTINFSNNVAYNLRNEWAFDYSRIIIFPGIDAATFQHNDIFHNSDGTIFSNWGSDNFMQAYVSPVDPVAPTAIRYTCNITHYGSGLSGLDMLASQVFSSNLFISGQNDATVPGLNAYPGSEASVGFVDYPGADFALAPTSPYKGGCREDGTDPGADLSILNTATDGVVSGAWSSRTPAGTVQFSAASLTMAEGEGRVNATVTRSGDIEYPAAVTYRTADNAAPIRCDNTTTAPGLALARCDYATSAGTLHFAPGEAQKTIMVMITDDAFVEGPETFQLELAATTGLVVGATRTLTLTIVDNDTPDAPNPVFTSSFFVRQHYVDFLSREPEQDGYNAWLGVLSRCPDVNNLDSSNASALCDRLTVSSSFFGSNEFKLKGGYVFRFYRAAFGRLPQYTESVADMSSVTGQTPAEVYQAKADFAGAFAQRPEFQATYAWLSNSDYVATLLGRYQLVQITTPDPAHPDGAVKVALTAAELVAKLNSGVLSRAQVLRAVAESDEVFATEYHRAFVFMQYVGYLRRDPDPAGFNAWLNYLNAHPTEFRTMVNGFMNSLEYRLRFGSQ